MGRVAIATALGGIVLFVWGFSFWAMMPYARETIHAIPKEHLVVDAFQQHLRQDGVYIFPGMTPEDEDSLVQQDDWATRHRKGPIGMLFYTARGTDPTKPHRYILGATLNLFTAFIAALLLALADLKRYVARVGFVFALGLFATLSTHLMQANWFYLPLDYIQLLCLDLLIGTLLMGLVVGAIVRPAKPWSPPE